MSIKHHQATVSTTLKEAGDKVVQKHDSTVSVYRTNYSFPSNGADYYVFNSSLGGASGPSLASPDDPNIVSYGNIGNLFIDWEGGGPEASTSSIWQTIIQGMAWGLNGPAAPVDVTFKLVYSGGVILSTGAWGSYEDTPSGNLSTVLIDDWDQDGTSVVQTRVVSQEVTGAGFINTGAFAFRLRYWNRSDAPHLVCFIKRDGIDDDFVVMGASTLSSGYVPVNGETYAATKTVLEDVVSWNIDRAHDNITTADILLFVDATTSSNAYDPETESFGDIRKGNYIEIEAGYNGEQTKRFVGNISGSTQISREAEGAYVTLHCESIEGFLIDSKNFNYPNNAMYSYAEYTTDASAYYEPNGIKRPVAFDQWGLTRAIRAVSLNAGVDDYYLNQYRQFYAENGTITTSTTKLIRDLNIFISRTNVLPDINVNLPEQEYLWVYDFGQDTAYDIIKDILSKYGYYLSSLGGGDFCGSFELIEVESPTDIITKINTGLSSNYVEGIPTEYAEGFLSTKMKASTSTLVVNWAGSGMALLMGVGPSLADSIAITYKVNVSDGDWTNAYGYTHDFTTYATRFIDTEYVNSDYNIFSYENINAPSGGNPSIFSIIFSIDDEGNPVPLPYGDHLIRLSKTVAEEAFFEGVLGYDFGGDSYKEYSTYDIITAFSVENSIADIRNDIVVLGAPRGGFSFVADEDSIANVQEKYVTSRAADPRSIYDPTYKFYVGRRKQFVIEDPTIVTQERADWLAVHVLEKYRTTSNVGAISIPCDLGLQVYDQINIEEVQTGSIDSGSGFYANQLVETYSKEEYSLQISYLNHWIPPSFRRREQITLNDIRDYFNNSPIAFERQTVPILDVRTGYDPMSAEDGIYIDFEWTLLVPGIHSLELFDTRGDQRIPLYHASENPNELVAVPFVGIYEYPGKYRARWDGVHEGYDLNSKFANTNYADVYYTPRGHGYGARGQDTAIIDEVHPIQIEDGDFRAAKRVYFPLYPVIKFQPIYPEHSTLNNVLNFGSESGTGYSDGVLISQGDNSSFDVQHFDLEERQKLYWNFDQERFGTATDQANFMAHTSHATDAAFAEDVDNVFIREQSRTEAYQLNNDITHRVMACDPKRPFAEPTDTAGYGGIRRRPVNMPMIDETVGVRMFVDGVYDKDRRYNIWTANLHIDVLTHYIDTCTYNITQYRARDRGQGGIFTYNINESVTRKFNYFFRQPLHDIPLVSFNLSRQTIPVKSWTFLPGIEDSTTSTSVIFETVLKDQEISIQQAAFDTINTDAAGISGVGVGSVFAIPINRMTGTSLDGFNFFRNSAVSYSILERLHWQGDMPLFLRTSFVRDWDQREFWESNREWAGDYIDNITGNTYLYSYTGTTYYDRKIYNSIVVSIEYLLIDRLGRGYYSSAKTDEGRVLVGRRNDIEFHSELGRELCKYVNRWDPYLPSACYFERSPYSFTHTDFGDSYLNTIRNHGNTTYTPYDPDYDGLNLTTQIHREVQTKTTSDVVQGTTLFPLDSVERVVRPSIISYPWYVYPANLPDLNTSENADGALFGFFGTPNTHLNSKVWHAHSVSGNFPRDHTNEPVDQVGPWGLPVYISGGFTNKVLSIVNHSGRYDAISELSQCPILGLPRDGHTWSNWYVREWNNLGVPNPTLDDSYISARSGLYALLKNAPVFTLVGGGNYTCNNFTLSF